MLGPPQLARWPHLLAGVCLGCCLGASSCRGGAAAFNCSSDTECVFKGEAGRCEGNGLCSFPNEDCASGFAFGEYAGEASGMCTDPGAGTGSTGATGSSAGSSDPTVLDTSDSGTDNGIPTAVADMVSTLRNTPVDVSVLDNDTDPDGDVLTVSSLSQPASGVASIVGDMVRYEPALDFSGTDTFGYTIDDGNGGTALGTVTVEVEATCDTWNTAWTHRLSLTFDNVLDETVEAEDLVDVPVLVRLDAAFLAQLELQPDASDLRFVDADDSTELSYEIESLDPVGTSFVWVKVPQIDAGSQTDFIWMYHGNASARDAQDAPAVWSEGFAAVWHMTGTPDRPQEIPDATGHGHSGAFVGTDGSTSATAGIIAGAMDLQTSESITVADHADFDLTDAVTIEAWVRPDVVDENAGRYALSKSSAYFIHTMRNYTLVAQFFVRLGAPISDFRATGGGNVLTEGAWVYLAGAFDAQEQVLRFFHDGELLAVRDLAAAGKDVAPLSTTDTPVNIGTGHDGLIDEVRVSSVARSAAWIAAQQRAAAGTFITFGTSTEVCR